MKNESGWYVLYTRSRHEKKISSMLDQKKIISFLPLNKVVKQWTDRKKIIEEPLFPCYLFIFIESAYTYNKCLECSGAISFVRVGGQRAQVKESLIEQLRTIVDNCKDIEVSHKQYQSGEKVMMHKGPLSGVSGEVVMVDGKSKIIVKVELLNRWLIVSCDEDIVSNQNASKLVLN